MARTQKTVDEMRTLAKKLESFVRAVVADGESTKAYVDSLKGVVDALGARQEAQGALVKALRNKMDSSDRVFDAFKDVARVSAEMAQGLDASRTRLDAIESAAGKLAEALKTTNARAAGDAARLLEEVGKLKESVDVLSMLADHS